MNRIDADGRLLPVLLICAQAVVWPGGALLRGSVPRASDLLVAVLVAGLAALLIGAAPTLINFFFGAGSGLH